MFHVFTAPYETVAPSTEGQRRKVNPWPDLKISPLIVSQDVNLQYPDMTNLRTIKISSLN